MTVINTNVKALTAQGAMAINGRSLSKAMEQLSTGKRINSAADDAAGFAISNQMTSQIRGLNMAVKNANDAVSLLQTAEGAMVEVNEMMQRMRELAIQSSSSTNSAEDRAYLQLEFAALSEEITRIRDTTEFNGMSLLNGDGDFAFQIGANGSETMRVSIDDIAGATAGGRDVDASITAADGTNGQISSFDLATEDGTTAFEEGDKIFLEVADVRFVYTITADDVEDFADAASNNTDGVGDAVSIKLAAMINSDSRMQGQFFAEATNDGTSTLTITGIDLDNAFTSTMSISAVTDIAPATTAADGTNGQITALDFGTENTTTEYEAGDVITLQVADTTLKYTITASDVLDFADAASNNTDGVGDAVSIKLAAMINSTASLQGVVLAEASNDGTSVLTLTGIDLDDSYTVVATSRGGSATGPVGDISTQTGATSAIDDLSSAIETLDAQRANLGAGVNRLTYTINNLTNISSNTEASRSRIEDTDYAKATAELSRTQIIQQAATAMLAQANQQAASVLSLLQ